MSAQSAIRMLQTAIENVREQCGKDPKCADLIKNLDAADKDAEKVLGQPYDQPADTKEEQTGKPDADSQMKDAAATARQVFADKRKAAAGSS